MQPPSDVANIRQPGAPYKGACDSSLTGTVGTELVFKKADNLTGFNIIQQLQKIVASGRELIQNLNEKLFASHGKMCGVCVKNQPAMRSG